MRVVLDTNVIVSALLWGGTPHRLIEAASEGNLILCTSQVLLDELREVLGRPHLASRLIDHRSTVERAVRSYAEAVVIVEPSNVPPVVAEDADDDHVIAAALAAGAAMIVSGDRHLLSIGSLEGLDIITPAEAVERLSLTPPRPRGSGA
ncbi:MAG TPA: putative toxin-antitoxin system toxin component, PIN family [Geminicoccus sp.]|nr:putative toxin-antitoxin system toxin component, PIN family [Geminicoccus sp.]